MTPEQIKRFSQRAQIVFYGGLTLIAVAAGALLSPLILSFSPGVSLAILGGISTVASVAVWVFFSHRFERDEFPLPKELELNKEQWVEKTGIASETKLAAAQVEAKTRWLEEVVADAESRSHQRNWPGFVTAARLLFNLRQF